MQITLGFYFGSLLSEKTPLSLRTSVPSLLVAKDLKPNKTAGHPATG